MIITSLVDPDLYKFTMMQVVLPQFPGAQVEYRFKCRNRGVDLASHASDIREEIRALCRLYSQDSELQYLRSMRFIKSDFVGFLGLFNLNEKYITVMPLPSVEIEIVIIGPWLHTILFEISVLAIVNEVYFRNTQKVPDLPEGRKRLDLKLEQLRSAGLYELKIADYGTRRRFSRAWHDEVLRVLVARLGTAQSPGNSHGVPGQLAGTSNTLLAMKLGLTPRLRNSQIFALESWAREYRGDLDIALSDVYGMSAFLRDFDLYFCKLFDGARQRHVRGQKTTWLICARYLRLHRLLSRQARHHRKPERTFLSESLPETKHDDIDLQTRYLIDPRRIPRGARPACAVF